MANRTTGYAHWQHPPDNPASNIPNMPAGPSNGADGPPSPVDKTELALLVLNDDEFKARMDFEAGVGLPSKQEAKLMEEPVLLPKPKTKEEEQALYARVMASLKERVIALEKEEDKMFDPDWPAYDDREGYEDDPLMKLAGNIGQDAALRSRPPQFARKL